LIRFILVLLAWNPRNNRIYNNLRGPKTSALISQFVRLLLGSPTGRLWHPPRRVRISQRV
jgi:hypothetical protein